VANPSRFKREPQIAAAAAISPREGVDWQNLMVLIYGKQGARRLRGWRQHSEWRNSGHFRRRARPTPSAAEAAT
jgi:hypothetical protein